MYQLKRACMPITRGAIAYKNRLEKKMNQKEKRTNIKETNAMKKSINYSPKIEESKQKDEKNIFNLEIYTRIAFYGLLIGFVYNYTYFKYCLDFNIFDVMEPNELLFSWIGVSSLLVTVIILFLTYLFIVYAKHLIVKKQTKILVINSTLSASLTFLSKSEETKSDTKSNK